LTKRSFTETCYGIPEREKPAPRHATVLAFRLRVETIMIIVTDFSRGMLFLRLSILVFLESKSSGKEA
jgi:hypothetical protein